MNLKKIILILTTLTLLTSCSNLSKNFVKKGEVSFKGGTHHDQRWSDVLTFSRTSWYHDMNLYFEVMAVRPVEKSPFSNWFSENERAMISDCGDFIVAMSYKLDSDRISQTNFRHEMERNGYRSLTIHEFRKNMKLHPDGESLSLSLYDIQGFCKVKDIPQSTIVIRFPGFVESTIF